MKVERFTQLHCHRATACNEVNAIYAHVCRTNAELEIGFRLNGDLAHICLRPSAKAGDAVELWRHTCFEVFVAIEDQAAYHEFNFTASCEWRAYAFRSYRDPDTRRGLNRFSSSIIDLRVGNLRLDLDVRVPLRSLSEFHPASPLRLGLSAIIEAYNGTLSYWALQHPAGKPDFHHPYTFALPLPAPNTHSG